MDTSGLPPSPAEWEELQRQCHPFPVYVDYIYGRPLGYGTSGTPYGSSIHAPLEATPKGNGMAQPTFLRHPSLHDASTQAGISAPAQVAASHNSNPQNPLTDANSKTGARKFLSEFSSMSQHPPVPFAKPSDPIPPSTLLGTFPFPGTETPIKMHVFRINELLQPEYAWMPDHVRQAMNAKVIALHKVMSDETQPVQARQQAKNIILGYSQEVSFQHIRHLQAESSARAINTEMPKIWQALRVRQQLPPEHHLRAVAGDYLTGLQASMRPEERAYVESLLGNMTKADLQGRSPFEVIPGWVARQKYKRSVMENSMQSARPQQDDRAMIEKLVACARPQQMNGGMVKNSVECARPPQPKTEGAEPPAVSGYMSALPAWASSPPQTESSPLPEWKGF